LEKKFIEIAVLQTRSDSAFGAAFIVINLAPIPIDAIVEIRAPCFKTEP